MKPHVVEYNPQSFTLEEFRKMIKELWDRDRKPTTYDYLSDGVKREIDKVIREEALKEAKKEKVKINLEIREDPLTFVKIYTNSVQQKYDSG